MKRQYAANYHLIETVARGDEPEAIGVSGLRPWRDQYSVFCTRTRIRDAFQRLIQNANCPAFLISYSSDGLLKDEELADLFEPLGAVSVERRVFPRFKSNQSELGPHVTEYLITLLKANCEQVPVRHAVGAT
jgi:adenine-specific DNA-methyltransferase